MPFVHSYRDQLPGSYTRLAPTPLAEPQLVLLNRPLLAELGLPGDEAEWTAWGSGNGLPAGADPLAQVYAGHQFGGWVPRLGDGRGLLLGEWQGPAGRHDLHLKGAGQTPYSRFGDGRAVLRSTIREFLASEALHALGCPTSRALTLVSSSEPVRRETIEPGAALIRVAESHIRFGHFEYFSHGGDHRQLRQLLDYCIDHHFPEVAGLPAGEREAGFFRRVCERTGELLGWWQAYGFAHGVMNTDNMSILGITFDFGPYAFLDRYEPGFICNHSDSSGRYAFHRQPTIALWNLQCLGLALAPLLPKAAIRDGLTAFEPALLACYRRLMQARLGLPAWTEESGPLLSALLGVLAAEQADYSLSFSRLTAVTDAADERWHDHFVDRQVAREWLQRYRQQFTAAEWLARQVSMAAANPQRVLRNYLAEIAIRRAYEGDFSEVRQLFAALTQPFTARPEWTAYSEPPPDWGRQLEISCSS